MSKIPKHPKAGTSRPGGNGPLIKPDGDINEPDKSKGNPPVENPTESEPITNAPKDDPEQFETDEPNENKVHPFR